jgi:predicted  nucleic acid-binding Zn-ribbon protein/predicted O-methyltransferase YrrM
MFWRPAWLEASAWQEHLPFAFWLIDAHRPKMVVELGAGGGTSYFSMCQAVDRLGLNTRCFAIDEWKDDPPGKVGQESVYESVLRHNDAQYSGFSRLVRSTFDDARQHFGDGSIDLLHIDGGPSLDEVTHDFQSWLPKLSGRAIVILHNTNVRESGFGVHRLFDGLRERHPTFEFVHGRGLGVVGVGSDQGQMLRRLFDAARSDEAQWSIREVFSRLGRSCADAYTAQQQQKNLRQLADDLECQRLRLEEVSQAFEQTRELLKEKAAELATIREQQQQQGERHAHERSHLNERVELLQEVKLELKEQVSRLQAEVDAARRRLDSGSGAIEKSRMPLATRESDRARFEAEPKTSLAHEAAVEHHEKERAELNARLEALVAENERLVREKQEAEGRFEQAGSFPQYGGAAPLQAVGVDPPSGGAEAGLLDKYLRDIEALTDAKRRAEASVQARFAETAQLTRQLIEHQQELAGYRQKVADVESAAQQKVDEAHQRLQQARSSLEELQGTAERLRQRIEIMESSRSWRWTSVLRRSRSGDSQSPRGNKAEARGEAAGEKTGADELTLLRRSDLFAADWYVARYPDVAEVGIDPVEHYLFHGARELRDPGPSFSTAGYLALYPDVGEAGQNPLVHYLAFGRAEGRVAPASELPR